MTEITEIKDTHMLNKKNTFINQIDSDFVLTPVMEKYILHWGEMGTKWGVNRTVSQIHALLYLAQTALNAEQITTILNVARSNVSNSIKELISWDLISTQARLGERKDYYVVKGDTWEMLFTIVEGRKKREIDPIMTMLRECEIEMENDMTTPDATKEKISKMLEFMETLTKWYEQIKDLPTSSVVSIMKMGSRITHFLPRKR